MSLKSGLKLTVTLLLALGFCLLPLLNQFHKNIHESFAVFNSWFHKIYLKYHSIHNIMNMVVDLYCRTNINTHWYINIAKFSDTPSIFSNILLHTKIIFVIPFIMTVQICHHLCVVKWTLWSRSDLDIANSHIFMLVYCN